MKETHKSKASKKSAEPPAEPAPAPAEEAPPVGAGAEPLDGQAPPVGQAAEEAAPHPSPSPSPASPAPRPAPSPGRDAWFIAALAELHRPGAAAAVATAEDDPLEALLK